MDTQGHTGHGTQDDATCSSQSSTGMSKDMVQDEERPENRTASGSLHEGAIRSK
jgi:hypothetical protein